MGNPRIATVWPESLVVIIDAFLEWTRKNRALDIYQWYRYRWQRFVPKDPESNGKTSPRIIYLNDEAFSITRRLLESNLDGELFRKSRDPHSVRHGWSGANPNKAVHPAATALPRAHTCR